MKRAKIMVAVLLAAITAIGLLTPASAVDVKSNIPINNEHIEIEAPTVGKKVSCDFNALYENYYEKISVYWFETDEMETDKPLGITVDSSENKKDYTFKADKYYTVLFNLKAKKGYCIENYDVTVNNNKAGVDDDYSYAQVWYCFGKPKEPAIAVSELFLNKTYMVLQPGETDSLTVTVLPVDATNKNVEFSSSDTSVATVDANGNIKAIKRGEAKITVTATGGIKNECTVSVFSYDDFIPKYDLATSVEGGGGRISEGLNGVDRDTTVTVLFIPDNGYELDKVTVNGAEAPVTSNSINIVMDKTIFVVAYFKKTAASNTESVTDEPEPPATEPPATEPPATEAPEPKPQDGSDSKNKLIILIASAVVSAGVASTAVFIILTKKIKKA